MIISKANGIRFWDADTENLPTFDSRPSCDLHMPSMVKQKAPQVMNVGQVVPIQVIMNSGKVPYSNYNYSSGLSFDRFTLLKTITIDGVDYDIYTSTLTATAAGRGSLVGIGVTGSLTFNSRHYSDPIDVYDLTDVEMSKAGFVKLKWTSDDNKFLFDYNAGTVNEMWVLADFYKYAPKVESVLFSNDEQTIKLNESVKRTLELEATEISENAAELIAVAMAHQYFYVNDVQYVSEEDFEITHHSNSVDLKAVLTQSNVLGLNTIGLDEPENDFNMQFKINPIQLGYVPSTSGNTQNLGEWVIASDGTNWIIDFDGRGKQWESVTGLPVVENLTNGGQKYVTVVTQLPTSDIDAHLSVFLNGNRLKYSGSSSATHPSEYGVDTGNNRIYIYNTLISTDKVSVVIITY